MEISQVNCPLKQKSNILQLHNRIQNPYNVVPKICMIQSKISRHKKKQENTTPYRRNNNQCITGCMQPRERPQTGICNGVQKSLEIIGSTPQGHSCLECWQLWPIMGGAGNGAAEEHWSWDFNPDAAAIWCLFLGPCILSGTRQLGRLVDTTELG